MIELQGPGPVNSRIERHGHAKDHPDRQERQIKRDQDEQNPAVKPSEPPWQFDHPSSSVSLRIAAACHAGAKAVQNAVRAHLPKFRDRPPVETEPFQCRGR